MESSIDSSTISHTWQRTATIDIRIPPEQLSSLLDFMTGVLERSPYLSQLSRASIESGAMLQYRLNAKDGSVLDVAIKFLPNRVEIFYAPYPVDSIKDKDYVGLNVELETIIRSYFSDQSRASLFLVFSPKMKLLPGKEGGIKKLIASVIFGNFLYLFMLILFVGIFLYQFFLDWTPIILVLMQFIIVIFANNLVAYRGELDITPDNASIYIAELRMKRNDFEQVVKSCMPKITEVKKSIYDQTLAVGKELEPGIVVKALNQYGSVCTPEFVRIKSVNVYNIVKGLANKYGFGEPRITLLNVLPPNAAATGISPNRATVLVTSGLLASMNEEEITTVLAHEFSHVRARDPLVLMTLATIEYLTRVYLFWPLLATYGLIIDFAYLFFSFTLLFFVAKFLEARADLDAAVITRQPKILAESLRKLGLYKYQSRAFELVNSGEWLKWDPHPPMYYRIKTLDNLDVTKMKHTFLSAIKGCVQGFINSFSGK